MTQPDPLTPKQREVWNLYRLGYGYKRIAASLGISRTAVRDRLDHAHRKLAAQHDHRKDAA